MKAKELNAKLVEAGRTIEGAKRTYEAVVDEIQNFVLATDNYDVVVGQEGCERGDYQDVTSLIKKAKKVFVFQETKYDHRDAQRDDYSTSKQLFEKNYGIRASLFDPSADFNEVVLFVGFCDKCFRDEYNKGEEAADKLRQRKDLIVRFYGLRPFKYEPFKYDG